MVNVGVFFLCYQGEILKAIIKLIAIEVMNAETIRNWTVSALPNEAMFSNVRAAVAKRFVTGCIYPSSTLSFWNASVHRSSAQDALIVNPAESMCVMDIGATRQRAVPFRKRLSQWVAVFLPHPIVTLAQPTSVNWFLTNRTQTAGHL